MVSMEQDGYKQDRSEIVTSIVLILEYCEYIGYFQFFNSKGIWDVCYLR